MNWKARSNEFFSGTRKVFPRMVISTSFSYGRKMSDISDDSPSDTWTIPLLLKLKHRDAGSNENRTRTCSMLYWRKRSEEALNARRDLRLLGEELAHPAEFFVALTQKFFGCERGEFVQRPRQERLEQSCGGFGIEVSAAFGFRHDFINQLEFEKIAGSDFQGFGGGFGLRSIAPHDGGAAFGGDHRVHGILQH